MSTYTLKEHIGSISAEKIIASMEQHGIRLVGDALLASEHLSASGNEIICDVCGKVKRSRVRSVFLRKDYWGLADGSHGCACEEKARSERFLKEDADRITRIYTDPKYMGVSKGYLSYCRFTDPFYAKQEENIRTAMRQVYSYCKKFSDNRHTGIYLHSFGPGLCKTSMMACARQMLLDMNVPCILTNVEEIVNAYSSDRELFNSYRDVSVLIIDDIGIQDPKESWGTDMGKVNNALYELLNARMLAQNNPTLFTSNYRIEELLDRGIKPQTVDRVRGLTKGNVIKISGTSVR